MRRREFIGILGGSAISWPLTARAQQSARLPTIGFLGPSTASVAGDRIAAFEERLRSLGWAKDATVAIDYRWADGHLERFEKLAAEFVRLKVDVIVTWGTTTAIEAKRATSSIPVVFTVVGDPVGSGLVASLARPAGNVTGLSTQHADTAGKRLGLLREVLPDLSRLAIMANVSNPGAAEEMREVEALARTVGIEVLGLEVRHASDIEPAVASLKGRAQALYVTADALFNTNKVRIATSTLGARLPTMHGFREIVAAGGLISYAPDYLDLFRRAGDYVDKILRGTKPADIPVEQPTKFELVVNLITAKALGLTIPPTLLVRADKVIE
jgi:putative ABC transport system substrate-binding protein